MATTLFDLILPEVATARVRVLPDEANYTLKQFMPERNISVIKAQLRIGVRNIKPAIFRSYDAETPVMARPGQLQQWDYMLPPLGGKIKLGEEDEQLLYLAGQQSPAANAAVIEALYNDLDTLARSVRASMEIGRAQYMSSGICTFPIEDGSTLSMDWQVPTGHKPTAATLWTDTTNSTPLNDEQAWIDQLISEGVGVPSRAVTSTPVRRLLAANAQYKAALYGSVVPTGLTTLTPNQVDSVREIYGLPPLTVYDTIINGARIFPTSKFVLVPGEGTVGETQFGQTTEARQLSSGANPRITFQEAPGLIGLVQVDGDPPRKETKVAAIGAPIPSDPNRILIATVTA
jgi:hypothetical protein